MRVLLLADAKFSRREHAFLGRLEIGLLGEGTRVLRAVPEASHAIQSHTLSYVVPFREHPSRFGRAAAYKRFANALRQSSPAITTDSDGVLFEIIHAFGGECWDRAVATAELTGAALVIELTSADDIRRARALERTYRSKFPNRDRPTWCTPNARIMRAAEDAGLRGTLALTPWGVHTPQHAHQPHPEGQPISISVVCSGAEPRAVHPLLEGFAALEGDKDRIMLFIDSTAAQADHGLWSRAESLGILEYITFVADMESRRDIVLETDALAIPEQMGELRTILLDAMASGMLILSRRDPLIEATAAEGVALLIDAPTREAWLAAFRRVLDAKFLETCGVQARERVREDRPAHKHIEAVLSAYQGALTPAPMPIGQMTQPPAL